MSWVRHDYWRPPTELTRPHLILGEASQWRHIRREIEEKNPPYPVLLATHDQIAKIRGMELRSYENRYGRYVGGLQLIVDSRVRGEDTWMFEVGA